MYLFNEKALKRFMKGRWINEYPIFSSNSPYSEIGSLKGQTGGAEVY